jgi:hypothetical protein
LKVGLTLLIGLKEQGRPSAQQVASVLVVLLLTTGAAATKPHSADRQLPLLLQLLVAPHVRPKCTCLLPVLCIAQHGMYIQQKGGHGLLVWAPRHRVVSESCDASTCKGWAQARR